MLTELWNRLVAWTGTIVAPDWGALVTLIPLLLLLVVLAFVLVTAAKWAGAGPRRNMPGRRMPVGPGGQPVRGPSRAPFVVAIGAFVLAFGLVAGGPWLPAGILTGIAGLAWLALETPRDARGHEASRLGAGSASAGEAVASASVSASRPGSARWALTPARAVVLVVVLVGVIAVAATAKVVPDAPAGSATIPPVPSGAGQPTLPPADATLEALNITFTQTTLTAPAGKPFSVAFDNRDKVPHNLEIRDSAGKVLFMGDIVTGPQVVVYEVPALPAGQYPFVCTVHPGMTGTLTVK